MLDSLLKCSAGAMVTEEGHIMRRSYSDKGRMQYFLQAPPKSANPSAPGGLSSHHVFTMPHVHCTILSDVHMICQLFMSRSLDGICRALWVVWQQHGSEISEI